MCARVCVHAFGCVFNILILILIFIFIIHFSSINITHSALLYTSTDRFMFFIAFMLNGGNCVSLFSDRGKYLLYYSAITDAVHDIIESLPREFFTEVNPFLAVIVGPGPGRLLRYDGFSLLLIFFTACINYLTTIIKTAH